MKVMVFMRPSMVAKVEAVTLLVPAATSPAPPVYPYTLFPPVGKSYLMKKGAVFDWFGKEVLIGLEKKYYQK